MVDLESELVLAVTVHPGAAADTATLCDSLLQAELNLEAAGVAQEIAEAAADNGYHRAATLNQCDDLGFRIYIPEPERPHDLKWDDKPAGYQRAVYNNRRRTDATDELLGSDFDGSDGWKWTGSSAGFPVGPVKYLARAVDNNNAPSPTRYATGLVNVPPTLGALGFSADVVHKGDYVTINALGVADQAPGMVTSVEFYRDANANGLIDNGDVSLGSDTTSADGWFKPLSTSTFPLGAVQIIARAKDNNGAYSPLVAASVWINNKPTIGSVTAAPATVVQSTNVTLTANSASDIDGDIVAVEIYLDLNANSAIDPDSDRFLGFAIKTAPGVWILSVSTADFPIGPVKYLFRAKDNRGAWSATKVLVGTVAAP